MRSLNCIRFSGRQNISVISNISKEGDSHEMELTQNVYSQNLWSNYFNFDVKISTVFYDFK